MENRQVFYAEANYGDEEINAVVKVLKNQRHSLVTAGNVLKFEEVISETFSKKYGLMVNSGSSANLLAIACLNLPSGGEVITPALTFSTTVAPLIQNDLVPVFVDCDLSNLQVNLDQIEESISDNTVALMIPNLIGNLPDWKRLRGIADKHSLILIEDSADTIGFKINGQLGNSYSDITTSSFYASHIITGAGTGGIVCFNDEQLFNKAKSLRSWGRRSSQYGETEEISRRLNISLAGYDYDDKYVFDDLGYNFIPSELSAAFALVQFKKLEKNISIRQKNFKFMKNFFDKYPELVTTFDAPQGDDVCWLAFPICLKGKLEGRRKELQTYLEESGIQTRTIFTGNIVKHPLLENKKIKNGEKNFKNSDKIMKNGILLGCHNSLDLDDLEYMCFHFKKFIDLN